MPADLPERIRFSLALRDLEIEMARLAEEDQLTVAARGTEQSRTITFDSDSLTIMIRIEANQDGTARVDGWLAPPQSRDIEMKTATGSLTVASDEQGRFAFARVPHGTAQLIVAPADHGRPGPGARLLPPRSSSDRLTWEALAGCRAPNSALPTLAVRSPAPKG